MQIQPDLETVNPGLSKSEMPKQVLHEETIKIPSQWEPKKASIQTTKSNSVLSKESKIILTLSLFLSVN